MNILQRTWLRARVIWKFLTSAFNVLAAAFVAGLAIFSVIGAFVAGAMIILLGLAGVCVGLAALFRAVF